MYICAGGLQTAYPLKKLVAWVLFVVIACAAITEAVGLSLALGAFLAGLRAATEDADVLLIFDEIITLRLARGGAQAIYDITPDLTTVAKIIGGGLPVGAFGGRADVMAKFDPRARGTIGH